MMKIEQDAWDRLLVAVQEVADAQKAWDRLMRDKLIRDAAALDFALS
jgi:hypothetical protein